jgi:hypothetical protein
MGDGFLQNLGRITPREREGISEIGATSLRGAKRRSNPLFLDAAPWIASRSLSSGARSRDPLARNDGLIKAPHTTIFLAAAAFPIVSKTLYGEASALPPADLDYRSTSKA